VTTSSDVYGLGAILYALLTGRGPFGGDSIDEILEQVRQSPPAPPSRFNPRTPRDLEVICLKCLEKEPLRRYSSAQALADDLGRYLAGEPIEARPTGALERAWLWCRRSPRLAGALGATAVALVAVAVLSLLYVSQQRRIGAQQTKLAQEEAAHARTQEEGAEKVYRLADNLAREGERVKASLKESSTRLALLNFERAEAAFEKEQTGPGLLWLAQSWRAAVVAEDAAWKHTARAALSGWLRNYRSPRWIFGEESTVDRAGGSSPPDNGVAWVAFSPDGGKIVTIDAGGMATTCNASTGRPTGKSMDLGSLSDLRTVRRRQQVPVPRDFDHVASFLPDGRILLIGTLSSHGEVSAQLWDGITGNPIGRSLKFSADDPFDSAVVALSPDGLAAITVSYRTARLYSTASQEPIGEPLEHDWGIDEILFSPDGHVVLTICGGTAKLWDAATAKPLGEPIKYEPPERSSLRGLMRPRPYWMMRAVFSPDGRRLWTGFRNEARLVDARSGRTIGLPIRHESESGQIDVIFSSDSRAVITRGMTGPRAWDAATAKPLRAVEDRLRGGSAFTFSPDGRTILFQRRGFQPLLLDTTTGQTVAAGMGLTTLAGPATLSPDGQILWTSHGSAWPRGQPMAIQLWDVATGTSVGQPLEHPSTVTAMAFSPDGCSLVTGCADGLVRVWDVAAGSALGLPIDHSGEPVDFAPADSTQAALEPNGGTRVSARYTFSRFGHAKTVALSPDGRVVVSANGSIARLWDVTNGKTYGAVIMHPAEIVAVAFSPDSRAVLTGGGSTTCLWDAATGKLLDRPMEEPERTLAGSAFIINDQPLRAACRIYSVAFSPDGRIVLTASDDATIRLWDVATGRTHGAPIRYRDHVDSPEWNDVTFSPDGRVILAGGNFRWRWWKATSGEPIGNLFAYSKSFIPNNRWLITTDSNHVRGWNLNTAEPIGPPIEVEGTGYTAVAISPDGETLVFGDLEQGARIWDLASARPRGPILSHPRSPGAFRQPGSAAFSPSGGTIVTSDGYSARLWDAATGRPLGKPMEHRPGSPNYPGSSIRSVMFSRDGLTVLTVRNTDIQLWDAATYKALGPPVKLPARGGALTEATLVSLSLDAQILLADEGGRGHSSNAAGGVARVWDLTLRPDDPERVALWLEVLTGLTITDSGEVLGLDAASYRERRDRLEKLGGPTDWTARWSLDPILSGDEPGARARKWVERHRWAEAEQAFDEAVRARPFNADLVFERGAFFLARGNWSRADNDFVQAYSLGKRNPKLLNRLTDTEALFLRACAADPGTAPRLRDLRAARLAVFDRLKTEAAAFRAAATDPPDDPEWSYHRILILLDGGDLPAARQARADMLDQYGTTTDPDKANWAAWAAVLTPGVVDRLEAPVQLAERAVKNAKSGQWVYVSTLGEALYRAGRFEAAIARLEEGIRLKGGRDEPIDWAFLAMAHHRAGHTAEARNWLDRFRDQWPITSLTPSWEEIAIRLLRSEAEALILYDPVFPADPFAH
jgi:WD40 repeat protein/tetratricopeptide (TPR) repeat protein